MIFTPELVEKIATGRKTQTRRPIKATQAVCRYAPGKDYAVQRRRGGPQVFRIHVAGVRREQLGDITPQDAQAEGFKNTDKFFAYWEQLYGVVDRDLEVWVLTFSRVTQEAEIYLGKKGGYTEIPGLSLAPEAPAVPPEVVDRLNVRRSKGLDRGSQEDLRRKAARTRANSLRDAETKAINRGLDISREVAAIDAHLEAIRDLLDTAA